MDYFRTILPYYFNEFIGLELSNCIIVRSKNDARNNPRKKRIVEACKITSVYIYTTEYWINYYRCAGHMYLENDNWSVHLSKADIVALDSIVKKKFKDEYKPRKCKPIVWEFDANKGT